MNNDKKEYLKEWPEENGKHFEGDIILNEEQAKELIKKLNNNNNLNIHKRIKRKFIGSNVSF
jgi:hypothetical protein